MKLMKLKVYYMNEKLYILDTKNYFTIYKKDDTKRPCIIIAPGGGYKYTSPRESEFVALKFLEKGYHAIVVNYREQIDIHPTPMTHYAYVVDYAKKQDYITKTIAIGFSAGGHVVASVGCHFKDIAYDCRPDLMILSYPVITNNPKFFHKLSFEILLGEEVNNEELLKYTSLENNVDDNTPDTFIWHTYTDSSVPVENTLLMINALKEKNINVESHIFPEGVHGLSLANEDTAMGDTTKVNPYIGRWFNMACDWIEHKL